jgi:hypothetical protein
MPLSLRQLLWAGSAADEPGHRATPASQPVTSSATSADASSGTQWSLDQFGMQQDVAEYTGFGHHVGSRS